MRGRGRREGRGTFWVDSRPCYVCKRRLVRGPSWTPHPGAPERGAAFTVVPTERGGVGLTDGPATSETERRRNEYVGIPPAHLQEKQRRVLLMVRSSGEQEGAADGRGSFSHSAN